MNRIVDVATLIVTVAGITVLVRPNSRGPEFVKAVTDGFANAVTAATKFQNA